MWFIYNWLIYLYGASILLASLFNRKARKWVAGRRSAPSLSPSPNWGRDGVGATAWFHCASLGEFEQGRPVMEAFRKQHPDWRIVLTFFSPSGYEIRKNYEGADHIFYLPLDTKHNARKFIEMINPALVVFVKYEYWFRYLDILYGKNIPVYFISAIFRKEQHFFKWYGGWALEQLKKVTGFFVQDEASAELLRAKGIERVIVSGDTRFDRVATIADKAKSFPLVEKFAAGGPVFLAGSTWPADEELILKLIGEHGGKMKFIIAPHEVGKERVKALRVKVSSQQSAVGSHRSVVSGQQSAVGSREPGTWNLEPGTVLFSELNEENCGQARVLIVDGIGYLMHLYQYATVAYIGGGFGVGIHNILEAATFGKPVIFGPKYRKFREAVELIEAGGAFSVNDAKQLAKKAVRLVTFPELLKKTSATCSDYVQQKKGATAIILDNIDVTE